MFLGWLPIIGPIIEGVFGFLNKKQDVDLEKYKVDGKITTDAILAANQLTMSNQDQIENRLCKSLILFPMSVWTAVAVWDYIVVIPYPDLVWGVKAFPVGSGLEYLPFAVLTYLFGSAWLNRKR